MSRIYFHSREGTVEVRGSERAHAGSLTNDIGMGILGPVLRWDKKRLSAALKGMRHKPSDPESLGTMIAVADSTLQIEFADGTRHRMWDMILNTSLRLGSRPLRLLARLHAQCEIHAWVAGVNRFWLSDVIKEGLRDGLMRPEMGWEALVEFLRSSCMEPVVTSYSVCEQFPNPTIADWSPPEIEAPSSETEPEFEDEDRELDWDAWYDLPDKEQWDLAMEGLRAGPRVELSPVGFDTYGFGLGATLLDLRSNLPELG